MRNLHRELDLDSYGDLCSFLAEAEVLRPCKEFIEECLQPQRHSDEEFIHRTGRLPNPVEGREDHQWRIDQAIAGIRTSQSPMARAKPDKTFWRADDHDVHFMTQLVLQNCAAGRWQWQLEQPETLRALCERAWWLMSWLRYIHKFNMGASIESLRQKDVKQQWLFYLGTLIENYAELVPTDSTGEEAAATSRNGSTSSTSSYVWHDAFEFPSEVSTDLPSDAAASTTAQTSPTLTGCGAAPPFTASAVAVTRLSAADTKDGKLSFPYTHTVPLVGRGTTKQQQGISWLLAKSRDAFAEHYRQTLAQWGFSPDHDGTCILLPAAWQDVDPQELIDNITTQDMPTSESEGRSVSPPRLPPQ